MDTIHCHFQILQFNVDLKDCVTNESNEKYIH